MTGYPSAVMPPSHPHLVACLPLALLVAGCPRAPVETGEELGPDPWLGVEAIPLDRFRPILQEQVENAGGADRLYPLGRRFLTFVRDPIAETVLVMDPFYRNTVRSFCIDTSEWPDFQDAAFQGRCDEEEVEVGRGILSDATPAVAVAVDETSLQVWVFTRNGRVYQVNADILEGNPFAFLRAGAPVSLDGVSSLTDESFAAVIDGRLVIPSGSELLLADPDGTGVDRMPLPGTARGLVVADDIPWVLTSGGLWSEGTTWPVTGDRVTALGRSLWITDREGGRVLEVTDGVATPYPVEGLLGPVAADSETGRVYAAVTEGVAILEQGAEIDRRETLPPVDLAVNANHEILVLSDGGIVSVFFDEEALADREVVDVAIAAFVEKPRSADPNEERPCEGAEDSVRTLMRQAARNRVLLTDLVAPVALGVTPHAIRRAGECGVDGMLSEVWDGPRTEVGVLLHDEPEDCADDTTCWDTFLAGEVAVFDEVGLAPTWISGATPNASQGIDWVEGLARNPVPHRYWFFGLSLLPEVLHATDPRAKEAYPLDADSLARAWTSSSLDDVASGTAHGDVAFFPGNSLAGFNLSGCDNLFRAECVQTDIGDDTAFEAEDIARLDLLLRRALASARVPGVHTWYFHLPDIGAYDYTAGCDVVDRTWTGEGCQGEVLQSWLMDVYARFVLQGRARFTLPSEVPAP